MYIVCEGIQYDILLGYPFVTYYTGYVNLLMVVVSDDCFISLTVNTVNFCKACLSLSRDLMTMYTSEQESLLTLAMSEIFQEQLNHIRTSLQSPDFNKEVRADNRNKYYKSQLSTKTLI